MSDGPITGRSPESFPANENFRAGDPGFETAQSIEDQGSSTENQSSAESFMDGVSQQERPYLKARNSYPHDPVQPRGVSAFSRFRSGSRNRSGSSAFGYGLELEDDAEGTGSGSRPDPLELSAEPMSSGLNASAGADGVQKTSACGDPGDGFYGIYSEDRPAETQDREPSEGANEEISGESRDGTGYFSERMDRNMQEHDGEMAPRSSFRQRTDRQLSRTGRMMRQNYVSGNGRNYGDRNYGDRNYGDRNYGDRNYGDRNYGDRNYGDRNYGDRNYGDRNYGDRNYGDRNYGDRNYGDRNYGRNYGGRNYGGDGYGQGSRRYANRDLESGVEQTYPAPDLEEKGEESQESRPFGRSGWSRGGVPYQRGPQYRSRYYSRENGSTSGEEGTGPRSGFGGPRDYGNRPYGRPHRRNQDGYSTYNPAFPELHEDRSSKEPLSLAEELADEMSRGHKNPASDGDGMSQTVSLRNESVGHLQKLSMQELIAEARRFEIGVPDEEHAQRQELIFQIIKEKIKLNGLLYGEGTLEILPDGFGFLRSTEYHYLSCPDDIYVSPSQIRRFGLKTGTIVSGQIRPPKENERYFALLRVEAINYQDPNEFTRKKHFDTLTPTAPSQRMSLESDPEDVETRVLDMMVPLAFGQRGLILSPPQTGRTTLLRKIAQSALKNYPDLYVFILLIDERPEEVENMRKLVQGMNCEVVCSTSDEPTMRHIQVADMVIEKAKRMVEYGQNVLILLDSMTQLTRAWHSETPPGMKMLPEYGNSFHAGSFQLPKRFFGSARCVEEGGSLTILATLLTDTNNGMDEAILEEFRGSGSVEITLEKRLQAEGIWPAVDLSRSGTRHEDAYRTEEELHAVIKLRHLLSALNPADAMAMLTNRLGKTKTNAEFLAGILNGTDTGASAAAADDETAGEISTGESAELSAGTFAAGLSEELSADSETPVSECISEDAADSENEETLDSE